MKNEYSNIESFYFKKTRFRSFSKALGPVGMARFLQQFETGMGDYTKERAQWLKGINVETIIEEIKGKRKAK